jgi:pyruvate-ferredoxin/flavodoxin oxidoreductase
MGHSQLERRNRRTATAAVPYNPDLAKEGKNPFTLDSKDPTGSFRDFILGEVRYASLKKAFPDVADELFDRAEKEAKEKIDYYKKLNSME